MSEENIQIIVKFIYLISAIIFVFGIKLLTKVRTARRGNNVAALGMLLAVVATLIGSNIINPWLIFFALLLGSVIGVSFSKFVKMTSMPELIAICNGVGGAASALVAMSYFLKNSIGFASSMNASLSMIIGSITFSGSLIAFAKLKGIITGRPIIFKGANLVNFLAVLIVIFLGYQTSLLGSGLMDPLSIKWSLIIIGFSLLLGVFLVNPIGGADMPVVVSLLNSYSGIAGAATGFAIGNVALIITGALIGASGIILTKIMCKAMNRSLANVLFGGFGAEVENNKGEKSEYKNIKSTSPDEVAMLFDGISSVIIVPGYGMAVAQAQHAIAELTDELEKKGIEVNFAIHPVAGRMPGHMNVLLAEANIDYDKLKDLDAINHEFKNTDLVYVIGANDVVNPSAAEDKGSPIYGMPILNVHEARTVIMIKRSLGAGFANIKNTLFEKDNCLMLFGDAKQVTEGVLKELKDL